MAPKRGINTSNSTNILFTLFNQGLQDGRYTDVTFKVGSGEKIEEFKAYSVVLRLASPVLDAKFSEKWNPSSVVEIPDDDPDAFRLLMKVLHEETLTPNSNSDNLMDFISILALADKYDVNEVAVNCRRLIGLLSNCYIFLNLYKAAKRLYIHDLVDETFKNIAEWLKHNAQTEFRTSVLHPRVLIFEDVKKLNVFNSEDLKNAIDTKLDICDEIN